jgi:hypothetical protein
MWENRRKAFHTKERLKELERGCGKTEKAFHTRSLKEMWENRKASHTRCLKELE